MASHRVGSLKPVKGRMNLNSVSVLFPVASLMPTKVWINQSLVLASNPVVR